MEIVKSPALRRGKHQLTNSSMNSQISESDETDSFDDDEEDLYVTDENRDEKSMATPLALNFQRNSEGGSSPTENQNSA